VAQWLRALHCRVSCATRDSGFAPRLCRDPGGPWVTHNWPSIVRVREGLGGRDILVSTRTSDSCGGPGQVHGVSSDTLVRLASGLDAHCVKKQCGLVGLCIGGCMTFDLRLPSPYGSCSDETR
jgi:hypothetical protein